MAGGDTAAGGQGKVLGDRLAVACGGLRLGLVQGIWRGWLVLLAAVESQPHRHHRHIDIIVECDATETWFPIVPVCPPDTITAMRPTSHTYATPKP